MAFHLRPAQSCTIRGMLPLSFFIPLGWMVAVLLPIQVLKPNRSVALWSAAFVVAVIWFGCAIGYLVAMDKNSHGVGPDASWGGMVAMFHDFPLWLIFFSPSIPALWAVARCYPRRKSDKCSKQVG